MTKHFGHKGLVLGAVLGLLVWAGGSLAAGNEVRLPVQKTVRLAPPKQTPVAEPAAPESAKAAPAPAAPKTAAPKAEPSKSEPAASAPAAARTGKQPAPEPAKAETPKPKAAPAAAPKAEGPRTPAPKAQADAVPALKPEPAPKPVPKPRPVPRVDPLALETPPPPAPHEPMVLPESGHFVGDVELEFQSDHVILRAATNGQVERVTFFGLQSPRKLALDLRGPWRKKGAGVLRYAAGPVKNVVTGEHPDRLRLALEFREGAVEPDMQPKVEIEPKGVTVTIPLALHLRR